MRNLWSVLAVAGTLLALALPASAQPMMESMDHSGVAHLENDHERILFARLLCTCGGCQREAIDTCPCAMADDRRDLVREWIKKGMGDEQIEALYAKTFGDAALSIPPNTGKHRLVYVIPLLAIIAMAAIAVRTLRRFAKRGVEQAAKADKAAARAEKRPRASDDDEYEKKLDDELRDLDG